MSGAFAGKVGLVTAAAAGIGAATAEAFARQGARVMLADIDRERGETVAAAIRSQGYDAQFQYADATNEAEVQALVHNIVQRFGGLHLAANIVGDAHQDAAGPEFHLQSVESWNHTLAVSLRSTFLCLKHEISYMIQHGGGAIANVTSLAGLLHVPESGAAYAAAKAGVVRLTRFAAVTYADRGVRVNCIAPGVTPTEAYNKAGPEMGRMIIERLLPNQPIRRTIATSEQAAAIVWLCSDAASMVNGHVLPVDGGWTARC
jgi:NAD(P)-dependent dehydrogenase (short-subunit alcohol dehydrogenase family)